MSTLEQLKQLAYGVAMQFGNSCEVVIHDVRTEGMENSIVCIEHGEISNRKLGDGPSHAVLEALKEDDKQTTGRFCYLTRTKDGRIFKSSTMYIRDEEGNLEYIFCINFEITDFVTLNQALNRITGSVGVQEKPKAERITNSVADLLDDLLDETAARIGKPAAAMNKSERMMAIKYLNDAGAFLISKSTDKIADYFGISKFTLYSDINATKEAE